MFNEKKHKLLNSEQASNTLKRLGQKSPAGKTKISKLLEDFHENGIVLGMIFFSLPVAIPLTYPPGFTTIMGTPLIILAVQMLLGYQKVKLPAKINHYQIKNSILIMLSDKIVPILKTIETYIKPRFNFTRSVYCEQMVGLISLICAISVAIPLPFTNAVPALGITIMALGLLNRDGLVIILGVITSIVGIFIALGAMVTYWVFLKYLFHLILGFLGLANEK